MERRAHFAPRTSSRHPAFTSGADDSIMNKRWWEKAIAGMADAGTLYGMPPAWVELVILEQNEREQLEREREAARAAGTNSDDDGDGGTRREREPVAV
jgi:hypothetical protein